MNDGDKIQSSITDPGTCTMQTNTIHLSEIVASFAKPGASIYTCEHICNLLKMSAKIHHITPQLHSKLHALVPEMINCDKRSVMDDWLNYEFFCESDIPEVKKMKRFLKLKSDGYGINCIYLDVEFKMAFFLYLISRFGDVEWSFVFDQV